ncbi:MAG: hypothetical protein AAF939_22400, partial [Planctomycetota bacterium]
MNRVVEFILLFLFALLCNADLRAQNYPTTSFPILETSKKTRFGIEPPVIPDGMSINRQSNFEAMSPDSWETPLTNQIPNLGTTNEVGPINLGPAPSQLDSNLKNQPQNSAGNFQQTGFPSNNSQPFSLLNNAIQDQSRYPLEKPSNLKPPNYARGLQLENADGTIQAPDSELQPPSQPQAPVEYHQNLRNYGPFPDVAVPFRPNPQSELYGNLTGQPNAKGHIMSGCDVYGSSDCPTGDYQPIIQGIEPVVYRPDLGHRESYPVNRNLGSVDRGQVYDFEDKKKDYPKIGEILATGRYFGSGTLLVWEPHFQANTAINVAGVGPESTQVFQFSREAAPRFEFGFESTFGPGIEFSYWEFEGDSKPAEFTSNGTQQG